MKKLIGSFVLCFCLAGSAIAQDAPANGGAPQRLFDYLTRELILRQLEDQVTRARIEAAQRREAQYREELFVEKANRFVQLWARFAREYNEKQAFNVRAAKEVSDAFHQLERSEGWPKLGIR